MSTDSAAAQDAPSRRPNAVAALADLRLTPAARALLDPAMTPRGFVRALLVAKLYVPAIDSIAHVLPPRLGLWWAMLCVQHATQADILDDRQMQLFRLALRWLHDASETNRKAAEAAFKDAGPASLGGLLCLAAAMHDRPQGRMATGNAVKLATTRAPPPAMLDTQRAYAVLGLQLNLSDSELATR